MLTETLLQGTFETGQGRPRHLVDQPGSSLNAFLRSSNFLDSVQVWTRRTTHLRSPATLSSAAILGNHPRSKSLDGGCVRRSHPTVWPYFLVHAERCTVVTVLFHLICGSFVQTTGREVADLPVSHELGKNIYSMYSVQRVHEGEGGLQIS